MDEQQIKTWLGVGTVKRRLKQSIIDGMANIPVPGPNEQLHVFMEFLRCAGRPTDGIWAEPEHVTHVRIVDRGVYATEVYHDGFLTWDGSLYEYFRFYAPKGPVIIEFKVEARP